MHLPVRPLKIAGREFQSRLMIGTGIYDLTTTVGPARYLVSRSDWPRDRVFQRQYEGGHMAYTHEPSLRAFTGDIRAWVGGGRPA